MAGPLYTSGAIPSDLTTVTFDNLPASAPIGAQIYVSDIGEYGAVYTGNGITWAHTGEIEIIQKGKGWLVPSLAAADAATYSQSGTTITVTSTAHAIPDLKYNTKDVYLNIGTAATGATIPPGWFSNFTYVSANSFTCTSTVSQTGTGAVNTNLAEIAIADLTSNIIGNSLGLNGLSKFSYLSSSTGNASAKWLRFYFGTHEIKYTNAGVAVAEVKEFPISSRNSTISQVYNWGGFPTVIAINTAVDVMCSFSLQCETANDYLAIHFADVYISPS
jgi:hypothetical protein